MEMRKERTDRGIKARSEDIFALSSWREMLYIVAPRAVPLLAMIVLSVTLGAYWQRVLISASVFGIMALSWDLLVSCGMVSLGQALFFGVGAYFAGYLNHNLGWSPFVTVPLAAVLGGMFCTLMLIPVLRLRGVYFSMVTMVLPLMFERIIEATKILGGTEGLTGITPFPNHWIELYVPLVAVWVALFGVRRLMTTDRGLVMRSINDNDRSVISSGTNIYYVKAQALFIGSAMCAFSGALMTHIYMFVGMPVFALDYSILPIASAVVGGMGTYAGAMLGSFILVPLSELLRGFGGLRIIIYSLSLVFFIVALPEGIFHYLQRKYTQKERWVKVES